MNWCEPKPWGRTLLYKLMQPHSSNGTNVIMDNRWDAKRVTKLVKWKMILSPNQDLIIFKGRLMPENQEPSWTNILKISSLVDVCWLAFHLDLDRVDDVMVTFLKEKNSTSI